MPNEAPAQVTHVGVTCVRFAARVDGSVRHTKPCDGMCEPTQVRPTDATFRPTVRRSGHIDRRVERCGDNPAGVIKMMACKVGFLSMSAIARIRLIWQDWRQIFQCRISFRMNGSE